MKYLSAIWLPLGQLWATDKETALSNAHHFTLSFSA